MDAAVQMNVRMSRALKSAGDEALALIGFSPSQAVRALWEKASLRGSSLEDVARLLAPADTPESPVAADAENPVEKGWAMMDDALRTLGIDPDGLWAPADDDEMLAEALAERMENRGIA